MMTAEAVFSTEDKAYLRRLLAVTEAFRALHPEAKVRWLSEILNPDDLRRHEVRLTSKGRALVNKMLRHIIG